MALQLVQDVGPVGRRWRRPKHNFHIRARPYVLQPFVLAPVLPGETLKMAMLQSRVVSDPIKNPLIGWWKEYYLFYVKLRDLASSAKYQTMLLTPGYDVSANAVVSTFGNVASRYENSGSMLFMYEAVQAITREYFRDEGEAWNIKTRDTLPLAKAFSRGSNWLDSLTMDTAVPDIDPNDASAQDLEKQHLTWEFMRAQKMTNLSFEDFLRTFGVSGVEESQRPELIRYVREWTYPTNTVEPTTGAPSSALSWSIQERADKDRFFKEHGFIVGITVTRPKVYLKNQMASAGLYLNDAFTWMPAALRANPEATLKQFAELGGPLPVIDDVPGGGYWLDMKDLFLYGDQFVNFATSAADFNGVSLPLADGTWQYVADADVDAMFKTGASNYVKEDGTMSLAILGTAAETS